MDERSIQKLLRFLSFSCFGVCTFVSFYANKELAGGLSNKVVLSIYFELGIVGDFEEVRCILSTAN